MTRYLIIGAVEWLWFATLLIRKMDSDKPGDAIAATLVAFVLAALWPLTAPVTVVYMLARRLARWTR